MATRSQYCAILTVPNLLAWFYTDPRIKRDLDAMAGPGVFYHDLVTRVIELTHAVPFDDCELRRTNADYRDLLEFLTRHGAAKTPKPATAAG